MNLKNTTDLADGMWKSHRGTYSYKTETPDLATSLHNTQQH